MAAMNLPRTQDVGMASESGLATLTRPAQASPESTMILLRALRTHLSINLSDDPAAQKPLSQSAVLFAAAYRPEGPVDELSLSNLEYRENFDVIPSVDRTGFGYRLPLEKAYQ